MRKHHIMPMRARQQTDRDHRVDLSNAASVEVTSEEKNYPIESALVPGDSNKGWRAAEYGTQTIRLIFDRPQNLKRIALVFEEKEISRTQEFVLCWSSVQNGTFREIVRQQWNFSSPNSIREIEEYHVQLSNVVVLELTITPDVAGGLARASLNTFAIY